MHRYFCIRLGCDIRHNVATTIGNTLAMAHLITQNPTPFLSDDYEDLNNHFVPLYLDIHPECNPDQAGQACADLWRFARLITDGDILLCKDPSGDFYFSKVCGDYTHDSGKAIPHRRKMRLLSPIFSRKQLSKGLRHATGHFHLLSRLDRYEAEVATLFRSHAQTR
jgi:predicted Mrr-cat superfamily restriction endonuclease